MPSSLIALLLGISNSNCQSKAAMDRLSIGINELCSYEKPAINLKAIMLGWDVSGYMFLRFNEI